MILVWYTLTSIYLILSLNFRLEAATLGRSGNLPDAAKEAAEEIVDKLVPKLKKEGATVIFLDVGHCLFDGIWCPVFTAEIERLFITEGLRYLPEDQRQNVRQKMNDAINYDLNKVIRLGQQIAVHAFVNISIRGDLRSGIVISGSSINTKEGLVTINESITLTAEKEIKSSRSILTWVNSTLIFGSGTAIATYGFLKSQSEMQAASDYQDRFKESKNPDEARKNKDAGTKHEEASFNFKSVGILGLITAAYGVHYFVTNKQDETYYHYDISFVPNPARELLATTFRVSMDF